MNANLVRRGVFGVVSVMLLVAAPLGSARANGGPPPRSEGSTNKNKFVEIKNSGPQLIAFQKSFSASAASQTFKRGNCSVTFSAGKVDGEVTVGLSKDGRTLGAVKNFSCSAGVSAALLDATGECGWSAGKGGTKAGANVSASVQDGAAVFSCDCTSGCEVFFGSRVQGDTSVNASVCGLGVQLALHGEAGIGVGVGAKDGFKKGKGFTLGGSAYLGVGVGGSVSVLPKFDGLGKKTLSCLADKGYAVLKFVGSKAVAIAGDVASALGAAGSAIGKAGSAAANFLNPFD